MPFKIVRNDITKMQVDAIVNTANTAPMFFAGVDTAVYKAAGEKELLEERRKIGYLKEGDAAITKGCQLPAKYIIHAVSPQFTDGNHGEEELLRSCYKRSLELAKEYACKSIAFPLIATGGYGYPKEEGIRIALDEINAFLLKNDMLIYLVVFDTVSTQLGWKLYPALETYIDQYYVCDKLEEEYRDCCVESDLNVEKKQHAYVEILQTLRQKLSNPGKLRSEESPVNMPNQAAMQSSRKKEAAYNVEIDDLELCEEEYCDFLEENQSALKERMEHISDTFQQYLMYLIEAKQLSNAEVYKRAIISKQLFSKIKLNPEYHPDKATAMRLCIGARLNLDETKDLLARAGYALSPCDKRDIIFSFFIEHQVFDMIEIDIALEEHGLPCFIE